MSNTMTEALIRAATLTFEDLGFMLPDWELDEIQRKALPEAIVSIGFDGPLSGELVLRLYGGLLPSLSSNMLGQEDPPDEGMQYDALGEIANVICGNTLPVIAGSSSSFLLGTPVVGVLDKDSAPFPEPTAMTALGLEEGRAVILLYLRETKES